MLRHIDILLSRRQEWLFATPLVEHTAVCHIADLIIERSKVAVHPIEFLTEGGLNLVVNNPYMPTPEYLTATITKGYKGITLALSRREAYCATMCVIDRL